MLTSLRVMKRGEEFTTIALGFESGHLCLRRLDSCTFEVKVRVRRLGNDRRRSEATTLCERLNVFNSNVLSKLRFAGFDLALAFSRRAYSELVF